MELTRDQKIQSWNNNILRKKFIEAYTDWEVWVKVDELSLVFWKYELSDKKWIIAMEYQNVYHSYPNGEGIKKDVKYFIHDPQKPFQPSQRVEYEITDLLKDEKMRLQAEKRAERNNPVL